MAAHFDVLKQPLAREIAVILLLKLVLLLGIRALWFEVPAPIAGDSAKVGQHMLGSVPDSSEKPLR
ncbi:cytochrome oxidase putative small subunit CydP [Pseudomonas sp. Marseille-Q5115]|uniref:cytochrome oxidase putative small subunit CydP n=1 Tax=Pseudomonas sp. Marseille-Q5115 TaxID=2866593 RepID=UPI001CE3BEFD|nr:cytochrome oxidase putative small subunit CydP [Pseudomonas sp. Marseille-Q5115]